MSQDDIKDELLDEDEDGMDYENSMYDEMDVDTQDLARDVNLPSNKDSKLWRLKVKPGMER